MRLGSLEFVDLYLGGSFADFKGLKGSPNLRDPAPKDEELEKQFAEIRQQCRLLCVAERDPEFSMVIDDLMFRVTMMREVTGAEIYVLRRSPAEVRPINQVGLAPALVKQLMEPNLKGLIILAGETGAGKTSTAAAILKARLDRIGGVAVTIEDPPEINLNGLHTRGRCMQIRASRRTGGYKEHLVRSLRTNPDMIFLGEVREEAAAQEVVEASLNGHLIISTIHAANVTTAIERLVSLAAGSRDPASTFKKVAAGLTLVIWQALDRNPNGGPPKYRYEFLSLMDDMASSGARAKIANQKIGHLNEDVAHQRRNLGNRPLGQ